MLDAVFAPERLVFIYTVRRRRPRLGRGRRSPLIVDIGAELAEVALLTDGRVRNARRTEIDTRNLARNATTDLISDNVRRHLDDPRPGPDASALRTAMTRRVLLAGEGAVHAGLATVISGLLRVPVHRAAAPRTPHSTAQAWQRCTPAPPPDHRPCGPRASGGIMTVALNDATHPSAEPMELLRTMLEEQFAVHTARLTQLTVYARLPRHAGYDPQTLDVLAASSRQQIAHTAQALKRMSEGTYGVCEDCHKPIPLGRLRTVPCATNCALCERRRPGLRCAGASIRSASPPQQPAPASTSRRPAKSELLHIHDTITRTAPGTAPESTVGRSDDLSNDGAGAGSRGRGCPAR